MARPKGPEQRVPVKMRVNIGLMDRLRQLAGENRYSVPKMLTVIMEETLADLPADYELHEMAEIYLAKNTDILSFYPNIWVPSGVCIVLAILAFNFIGDGLRDALDPKMKR